MNENEIDYEVDSLIVKLEDFVVGISMEDHIALLQKLSARCTRWAAKLEFRLELQGDVDRA